MRSRNPTPPAIPPFDAAVAGRWWRRLAPAGGLTAFGASHVVLKPGGWSSQRHWHRWRGRAAGDDRGRGRAGRGWRPDDPARRRRLHLASGRTERPSPDQRKRCRLRLRLRSAAVTRTGAAIRHRHDVHRPTIPLSPQGWHTNIRAAAVFLDSRPRRHSYCSITQSSASAAAIQACIHSCSQTASM
jgi:hypothetical protein